MAGKFGFPCQERHRHACRTNHDHRCVASGDPMPTEGWMALVLGVVFSLIVGVGLMALLFYSSRKGYDDPSQFRADDRPE
ncbi:hypothetical protein [Bradyrhizobium sp.]|uniref:hypothetical protein n=1 Tax=Bradyrhizobium sp. TaxID=376 RepID=UPI003967BB65